MMLRNAVMSARYQRANNIGRVTMQEDEIGLRKTLGQANYVQCSRCGALIPAREATEAPADALDEVAEYQILCPACRDELAAGEQDLPLVPE